MESDSKRFYFNGNLGGDLATAFLGALIIVATLGVCYPIAVVLRQNWCAKHSFIDGKPLVFSGSAKDLFVKWLKWLPLIIITFGLFAFWVRLRVQKWKWENTNFAS